MGWTGDWRQALAWLLGIATRELTLFAAIGIALGGLDDLVVDVLWLLGGGWHRFWNAGRPETTLTALPLPVRPGPLAIFVPAWEEAAVIGAMLSTALARWDGDDFRIFVGTYPNDRPTVRVIEALDDPRITIVQGKLPGPTSKAECLNRVWRAMRAHERAADMRFKAVVLHDAEDVVHPQELALYDRVIEQFDFVQIPVFPLSAHGSGFGARTVAGVYQDEFADGHSKQLVVRQAIGASVPSAGVGSAIAREWIARVAASNNDAPFNETSLTEDYELGLAIAALGGRGAFVTIAASAGAPPIAVRAHFPESFKDSIRQKTRWTIGIALAGWDRLGWRGGLAERWMRFRDRRAPLAAAILCANYLALGLILLCKAVGVALPTSEIAVLLTINLAMLILRAAMRALVVMPIYGVRAAVWSIPRMFVASYISIRAAYRALRLYQPGRQTAWDKTAHVFPDELPCD